MKLILFILGLIGFIYMLGPMSRLFPTLANFFIIATIIALITLTARWLLALLRQSIEDRDNYYEPN